MGYEMKSGQDERGQPASREDAAPAARGDDGIQRSTPAFSRQDLRRLTAARIALGHTGISLPTGAHLDFQLAHARARDAVHHALDVERVGDDLHALAGLDVICLRSRAETRATYLRRPDLGRRLDDASRELLLASAVAGAANPSSARASGPGPAPLSGSAVASATTTATASEAVSARTSASEPTQGPASSLGAMGRSAENPPPDVLFVVADGLSSIAIERNAAPLLQEVLPLLAGQGLRVGPLSLVQHGRVAIGDEIAECLKAPLVVVLIGERPGLSAPDSMGIYLTWHARVGTTDEARNCISNVRPEGLPHPAAARRLLYLIREARARRLSGVALKDESGMDDAPMLADGASGVLQGG